MPKTRKNNKRRNTRRVKYYMKGCSHKGKCTHKKMLGGTCALAGSPWTPNNGGNYYKLNTYAGKDPQTSMQLAGGYKKKRGGYTYKKHGGGIVQIMRDLGEGAVYNVHNGINILGAKPAPVNPIPYEGQFRHKF